MHSTKASLPWDNHTTGTRAGYHMEILKRTLPKLWRIDNCSIYKQWATCIHWLRERSEVHVFPHSTASLRNARFRRVRLGDEWGTAIWPCAITRVAALTLYHMLSSYASERTIRQRVLRHDRQPTEQHAHLLPVDADLGFVGGFQITLRRFCFQCAQFLGPNPGH